MISYPLNIIFFFVSGFGLKVIESDKERPSIVITRKAYDLKTIVDTTLDKDLGNELSTNL